MAELSAKFGVHVNQILDRKSQLLTQSTRVFESAASKPEPDVDLKTLHAKIGHQALQIDFLESALSKAGILSVRK